LQKEKYLEKYVTLPLKTKHNYLLTKKLYIMKNLFTLFQILVIFLVAFASNAQTDCNPATVTNVIHEDSGNRITWNMPTGGEEVTISQQSGNLYDGCGAPEDYGVFHRFTPEELATINGGKLTQIVFIPTYLKEFQTEPGHTYTVQIYKGGKWGTVEERNPGTIISFQELSNDNLLFHNENTITLGTPITIDASQELWIGYFCTNIEAIQSQYKGPAGVDAGPCKEGVGNVMLWKNQWLTLYEVGGSSWKNNNWCIKGIVQTVEGESVNIYFNGNKIKSNIEGNTYFHENPTGEEHCYKIEVNCSEGVVSHFSNEICIPGVGVSENGEAAKFTVYPNPASEIVNIQSNTIINSIQIINIMGQEVFSSYVNGEKLEINTSNFNAGLYFVKIHTVSGIQNAKLIIE